MTVTSRLLKPITLLFLLASVILAPQFARGEWQAHHIRQGDGKGGWATRAALRQVLKHPDSEFTMPFSLVQMGNGEIAILVSREKAKPGGGRIVEPNIAFSKDDGASWSAFHAIANIKGRPVFLTWLGGKRLSFATQTWEDAKEQRVFSDDYGRSWHKAVELQRTTSQHTYAVEGNNWVDRNKKGQAQAIFEIGWHLKAGRSFPAGPYTSVFRRSADDGHAWGDEVSPVEWQFTREHAGKRWVRGTSEGSLVRAANGDLVAALRTDAPPRYFEKVHDDSLEGTAISISKDNGKTWSRLHHLFEVGRHHANLQRLPNGHLVCTVIVRQDIQAGKRTKAEGQLTSLRRGCDAVISKDNGRTWNLTARYELDGFDFLREDGYYLDCKVGHVSALALADGNMLCVYGDYRQGAVLIKWKPRGNVKR